MSKPVLMYCLKHDSGVSSFARAVAIANRLCDRFSVVLVADTKLPDGLSIDPRIDFAELPPLVQQPRSSATARNGNKATFLQSDIARRSSIFLERYSRIKPDVILIEEYPVGENRLCRSLMPMLERVRFGHPASPLVVGSVSHFFEKQWNDNRAEDDKAAEILNDYFDALLVHSDSGFVRLGEFFQPENAPSTRIYHTGFIAAEASLGKPRANRERHVVVSLNGAIDDGRMCRAAMDAHRLLWNVEQVSMTLAVGQSTPDSAWRDLAAHAESLDGLELRRTLDNPAAEYSASNWIVAHVDRDSALDVVASRIPALLVPVDGGRRGEQADNARRLAYWGVGKVMMPHLLNGVSLANSLHQMIHARRAAPAINLDGAEVSANILYHLLMNDESSPRGERARASTDRLRPH